MCEANNPEAIRTTHLLLVAMRLELLRAEQTSYAELGRVLCAEVAPDWPPENWEPHVFGFIERQYADDPATLGWNRYMLLRRDGQQPILIGTVGGFRRSEEEAEIGYSVVPGFQRLGYASEAAAAFVQWMFAGQGVTVISAQTYPALVGSLRVMEHCGMWPAGEGDEAGIVRSRREKA